MLNSQLRRPFLFVLLSMLGFIGTVCAQVELQKIAPKAPNTAALLRISENNISHYTGAADINFPLYTVQSGALQLTLSLSYSSTGNKVEDIASWVGLGWNLGTIPMVARTVRGLPDEHHPGVTVGYPGGLYKLDTLIRIQELPGHHSGLYGDVVVGISNRQIDMEPDIFTYTLLDGRSGTFYWDPYQEKYQTHPYRSFKIEKIGAGSIDEFLITDESGITYKFNEYETSQSSGTFNGPQERNAWYVQKVYNVNRTDSISFGYATETMVTKTLNPHKRQLGVESCPDNSSIMATTTVQMKIPNQIAFRDGYVQFIGASASREDLEGSGAYALAAMKIYNYREELIKIISFNYTYTSATVTDPLCNLISSRTYEKKRLFLSSFCEKGASSDSLKYSFEYNTSIASPCRVSSAQDFWGYYNGETYNENLLAEIPARFGFTNLTPGAIRFIDTVKNQFGILKQITYPTGGKTEFSYETHRIESIALPAVYLDKQTYLTDEHEVAARVYIDTINIYSEEDKFINAWEYGGSFVDIILGDKECTGETPPPNCAEFYVRGIDTNNSDISFPLSDDIYGHRLKKGRYEIKASFAQAHTTAQGFFMLVKWREVDTTIRYKYVGGLRVKRIQQFDNNGNVLTKEFKYQSSLSSDSSSGVSLGDVNLFRVGIVGCSGYEWSSVESHLLQQSSATVNSFGGSYVAYNRVFEFYDSIGANGYREYEFLPFEVIIHDEIPYKPSANVNEFRAKPIYIKDYRKSEGIFQLLQEQYFHYNEIFFSDIAFDALATSITHPYDPEDSYTGNIYFSDIYQLVPALCNIQYQITKQFDPVNNSVFIQTDSFFYNTKNYAPHKVVSRNSKGELTERINYYSIDSASSGQDTDVWEAMIAKNVISFPTKVISKVNGNVTETLINKFDVQLSPERLNLKELFHSYGSATPALRAQFTFNTSDQLIEQQMKDDVKEVYLWGYGGRYPVAKILNSTHATALSYVNQTVLNNPTSDEALRTELENLFSIPNALVEFYTYRPGVGVSSITDTRGRTSYYHYDGHNRLSFVLDHDGKVLKKYCYNYAGQSEACTVYYSVADSASFTRNNCGTGYTGGSVTYVIPAGKYTSYASQADANAQAQADIDANGQAYANTQGTCTQSIYAKLTYENYNYSYSNAVHADVVVRFYSDASCTTPLSVSNLTIQLSTEGFDGSDIFSYDYPETVSGTYFVVEANAELSYDDGMAYRFKDYFLLSGTGYTVVW